LVLVAPVAVAQHPHEEGTPHDDLAPSASASASAKPFYTHRIAVPEKDGMLLVPGGRFTMGANDKLAAPNEKPTHSATSPAFYLDKTEVTVGAYASCVSAKVCARPALSSAKCTFDLGEPNLPVSCVRWQDALAYCRFVQKRLPREIEWELAARGTTSATYPWGGSQSACIFAATLIRDNSGRTCTPGHPSKVGMHAAGASVFGLLDMSGNVEEWVQDWYAPGPSSLEPTAGASHVLRGGGWLSMPSMARATSRNWGSSMEAGPNVGFRCAKDP
jgi:formylglycine-generating enzyme required for sulfatase activity